MIVVDVFVIALIVVYVIVIAIVIAVVPVYNLQQYGIRVGIVERIQGYVAQKCLFCDIVLSSVRATKIPKSNSAVAPFYRVKILTNECESRY